MFLKFIQEEILSSKNMDKPPRFKPLTQPGGVRPRIPGIREA